MNQRNGKCNSKHQFGGNFFDPKPIWSQQNPIAFSTAITIAHANEQPKRIDLLSSRRIKLKAD